MGRFIVTEPVILGFSPLDVTSVITEVEMKALTLVPCLASVTDPEVLAAIESMLTRYVVEWMREAQKIASQTTGPWSITYAKTVVSAGNFSTEDLDWLRRLSGCDTPTIGLPRGKFPRPPDLSSLFVRR